MAKYRQIESGEWVTPDQQTGYRVGCCDCGLVHVLDFAIKKGKVIYRVRRDNRATAAKRRHKTFVVTYKHPDGKVWKEGPYATIGAAEN